jgi:hypothetical protein
LNELPNITSSDIDLLISTLTAIESRLNELKVGAIIAEHGISNNANVIKEICEHLQLLIP